MTAIQGNNSTGWEDFVVDYYTDEHPSITWKLEETMEGLSERLVWNLGVRGRHEWELNSFLRMLGEHGSCTVVIEDPNGEVVYFPCHLPMHQLVTAAAA